MCGISGIFNGDISLPIAPNRLAAMAAMLHHRGPDNFGYKTIQGRGIGFSHARLSIIGLDENKGRQPFLSEDQNLLLVQNGEFYDYKKIRANLSLHGAKFQTKVDTEIVLHLYPRYGLEGTLRQLRGDFAFSLYDKNRDICYLVRDRFGVRPLYWALHKNQLFFASEIKAIFANPEVPRKIGSHQLLHQIMQTMVPGMTAFEGINQLNPGHYLEIKTRRWQYFGRRN